MVGISKRIDQARKAFMTRDTSAAAKLHNLLVQTQTSTSARWVDAMMREELGMSRDTTNPIFHKRSIWTQCGQSLCGSAQSTAKWA